jgi:hypothetical protein
MLSVSVLFECAVTCHLLSTQSTLVLSGYAVSGEPGTLG